MEMKFCQSCGMPLTPEILGTNADGSKNEEYCIYCYKDGAFTGDFTMEQMVEFCSQFVDEFNKNTGKNFTREEYKVELRKYFPTLKRWKSSDAELPHANSPIKQKLIEEVNALNIKGMPTIDKVCRPSTISSFCKARSSIRNTKSTVTVSSSWTITQATGAIKSKRMVPKAAATESLATNTTFS